MTRQANYTGSNRMITETFASELSVNSNYTVTITVMEDNFETEVSQEKNISKFNGCNCTYYL